MTFVAALRPCLHALHVRDSATGRAACLSVMAGHGMTGSKAMTFPLSTQRPALYCVHRLIAHLCVSKHASVTPQAHSPPGGADQAAAAGAPAQPASHVFHCMLAAAHRPASGRAAAARTGQRLPARCPFQDDKLPSC